MFGFKKARGNFALILFCGYFNLLVANNHVKLFPNEIRSLSELPLDKLLQIKSSFIDTDVPIKVERKKDRKSVSTLPAALPLKRSEKKPNRRYEDHYYEEKGKDSKISKIFQLAITTLSFLAFGGYLLALIIAGIRRNAVAAPNSNVIFLSNLQNLQKYKRPKRNYIFLDPMANDFDTERLYKGMIMLSRGYALYN
ncbi:uncharacterized protein LOC107272731 [Cephus cinctus]|uniref:Uncharacterized protein LOC107272731 n=1 Tax=Cephus cinctus TaxID=211228 RepID=A0AAJ7RSA5_CEPCN|nr:uncharacterized protein LOC107272731 [Cephus cinctus]